MQLYAAGTITKLLAWLEGEPTYNLKYGGTEMAHCVKGLAIKSESPSSIPGTHLEGGENQLLKAVLCMAHVHPTH